MSLRPQPRARPVPSKKLAAAARRLSAKAGGALDVAIVLGSGLSGDVATRIVGHTIAYARLHAPVVALAGHAGVAHAGSWNGKRVVAFAGRAHLYAGFDAREVTYLVRLAAAAGARTIILTNAAGGLRPDLQRGSIVLLRDHINLTGTTPLDGTSPDPFLDMTDAYAPHLRALAHEHRGDVDLREGVYAGVRGPQYETPAEAEAIRRMGADAVGMSTVLETIEARSLGCSVLAFSVITNAAGEAGGVTHDDVLDASSAAARRLAELIGRIITAL